MNMSSERVKDVVATMGLQRAHGTHGRERAARKSRSRDDAETRRVPPSSRPDRRPTRSPAGEAGQLDAEAIEVIRAEPRVPCDLPGELDVLVRALHEHMDFEEHALAADLVAKEMWGSASEATLRQEHARQREELARLTREAGSSDDRISLALAIRCFVSDVSLDMALEERRFFSVSP